MVTFKAGVAITGITPEMVLGLLIASGIIEGMGFTCIVTSCTDGTHKVDSLHSQGRAVDLRTRHVVTSQLPDLVDRLRRVLGPLGFEVLHEDPDGPNAHLHIEHDPTHTNGGHA